MGIKNLNKFLREKCSHQSIRKQKVSSLENKTIVVDTSIYLYRFMAENAFMENMYLLISILLSFKINPIFIFDGKPPPEKQALLKQRRIEKKEAEGYKVVLVRGLRNGDDLAYEDNQLKFINDFKKNIDVVFFRCDEEFQHISSSAIRNLQSFRSGSGDKYLI